jgi:hypothetical protein
LARLLLLAVRRPPSPSPVPGTLRRLPLPLAGLFLGDGCSDRSMAMAPSMSRPCLPRPALAAAAAARLPCEEGSGSGALSGWGGMQVRDGARAQGWAGLGDRMPLGAACARWQREGVWWTRAA